MDQHERIEKKSNLAINVAVAAILGGSALAIGYVDVRHQAEEQRKKHYSQSLLYSTN